MIQEVQTVLEADAAAKRHGEGMRRAWYYFSRNRLAVVGLVIVVMVVLAALLAPWVTPYPRDAGPHVDIANGMQPPSLQHPFGTDGSGRDLFTRVLFGLRFSLTMAVVVVGLSAPPGVIAGLLAAVFKDTWVDTVVMRLTDVFLALPPLILAMAITAVLPPNVFYAMLAVTVMWWPWYTRLIYGLGSSLRNELYVRAADLIGASKSHIMFREMLPNMLSSLFTKITLDFGFVIIIAASLSFVGLGAQPPTPDLGTMVADGAQYLPDQWWVAIFPALAIVVVVLGFNLLGDGLKEVFSVEER